MKTVLMVLATLGLVSTGSIARAADTLLWLDDNTGHVGQVDVTTQSVVAGSVITVTSPGFDFSTGLSDIGFTSSGTLYGSTFTNLFSINTTTGAATNLGTFNNGGSHMVSLVGYGTMLLGADKTTNVYLIDPANPGALTLYATSPAPSAGDLEFAGATLYDSGVSASSGADELIDVSNNSIVGLFHVSGPSGATLNDVFALADDGTTMYAAAGTEIYSVNLANAVLTPLFDYSGQGLTQARGAAVPGQVSVSEPATLALLVLGLSGIRFMRWPEAG